METPRWRTCCQRSGFLASSYWPPRWPWHHGGCEGGCVSWGLWIVGFNVGVRWWIQIYISYFHFLGDDQIWRAHIFQMGWKFQLRGVILSFDLEERIGDTLDLFLAEIASISTASLWGRNDTLTHRSAIKNRCSYRTSFVGLPVRRLGKDRELEEGDFGMLNWSESFSSHRFQSWQCVGNMMKGKPVDLAEKNALIEQSHGDLSDLGI